MPRRVPDEDGVFSLEILDLLVEQPVIRGQSRQEHQLRPGMFRSFIDPVVDRPAGGLIGFFQHACVLLFRAQGHFFTISTRSCSVPGSMRTASKNRVL